MTEPLNQLIVPLLCGLLLSPSALMGQTPAAPAQEPVFVPGAVSSGPAPSQSALASPGIRILVLEGRLRPNRLAEGVFSAPVVEIRDSNDKPVEGAQVVFSLPGGNGAGASFRDGSLEKTFSTNAQGQAYAEGYVPNSIEGKFTVRVRAMYQGETTEIVIPQSNTFQLQADADRQKGRAWRKWLIIGGIAAAGAVTAIILTRSGSSDSGVITVTPGPPVFGGR